MNLSLFFVQYKLIVLNCRFVVFLVSFFWSVNYNNCDDSVYFTGEVNTCYCCWRPVCVISGGSVWGHIERHRRLHHQPRIPGRVRKQPGLHLVHPVRTGRHDSSRLQRLPVGGQVRLPGNQRDRCTKHMVRDFPLVHWFVLRWWKHRGICWKCACSAGTVSFIGPTPSTCRYIHLQ